MDIHIYLSNIDTITFEDKFVSGFSNQGWNNHVQYQY